MAIKNLMEDVVSAIVDEALKKKTNIDKKIRRDDIISYVLNRIPPKYYTSERGILHGVVESQILFQQKTDILLLTYDAIKTIKKGRESELGSGAKKGAGAKELKDRFLPYILGEILEETTFSIISGVKATLVWNGKKAEMLDTGWKNPYVTNDATRGFFHFWPKLPEKESRAKKLKFKLEYSHPDFIKNSIEFEVPVIGDKSVYKSQVLPAILMKTSENKINKKAR